MQGFAIGRVTHLVLGVVPITRAYGFHYRDPNTISARTKNIGGVSSLSLPNPFYLALSDYGARGKAQACSRLFINNTFGAE